MEAEAIIALVIQTVVLVLAVVASARHGEKRMSTMETHIVHLQSDVKQIPGISRAVARLEGKQAQ